RCAAGVPRAHPCRPRRARRPRVPVDAALRAGQVLHSCGRAGDENRGNRASRGDQSGSPGRRGCAGRSGPSRCSPRRGTAGMKRAGTIVGLLAVPTVVYIVAVVLAPGRSSLITHVYLVVVVGG